MKQGTPSSLAKKIKRCIQTKSHYKRVEVVHCRVELPIKELLQELSGGNVNQWLYTLIMKELTK